MKKILTVAGLLATMVSYAQNGSVGIGTTTPNTGAALEIKSSDKAVLLPRLIDAAINNISTATEGMTAYDLDKHAFTGYVGSLGSNVISQNTADHKVTVNSTTPIGQSFTTTSSFKLQDIGVFLETPANTPTTFTMNIYPGANSNNGAASLGATTVMVSGGIAKMQNFNFSNAAIMLQSAQVYTFTVVASVPNTNTAYIYETESDPYSGGILYGALVAYPAWDLQFAVRTTGTNSWQQFLLSNQTNQGKLTIDAGGADALTLLNGGDVRLYDDPGTSSILFYAGTPSSAGVNKAIFTVASDGRNFSFNGTGGSVSSDARLKQDIVPVGNSLKKVMQLNGYSYRFKTKATDARKEIGVLAQEVKKVLPEAVYTDDKGMYSVSYNSLVPLLINAVKEQQAEIEKLKQENKTRQQKLYKALSLQAENTALKRKEQDLAKRMEQLEAIVLKQQTAKEVMSNR